jgi:hypothetical protein
MVPSGGSGMTGYNRIIKSLSASIIKNPRLEAGEYGRWPRRAREFEQRKSNRRWALWSVLLFTSLWSKFGLAQEYGPTSDYGVEGKNYSVAQEDGLTREAYLLSQRSYRSEDSFGYEGNVRHLLRYEIGGYEVRYLNFFVRCSGDGELSVRTWEVDEQDATTTTIQDKPPTKAERQAYNLYWAMCHDKFNWFGSKSNTTEWVHNGSLLYMVAKGRIREFYFSNPRAGLIEVGVGRDTPAFRGIRSGDRYSGTAYVFSKTCGAIGYPVSGEVSADQRSVKLTGKAPWVDAQCQTASSRDATLLFELLPD